MRVNEKQGGRTREPGGCQAVQAGEVIPRGLGIMVGDQQVRDHDRVGHLLQAPAVHGDAQVALRIPARARAAQCE